MVTETLKKPPPAPPKAAVQTLVSPPSKGGQDPVARKPRAYVRSNFHKVRNAVRREGIPALDGRSSESRDLRKWRGELVAALGGDPSPQEKALVELVVRDLAVLSVADRFLQENAHALINKRRKSFIPLVSERLRVAASVASHLRDLGLHRRARPITTLAEIMKSKEQA